MNIDRLPPGVVVPAAQLGLGSSSSATQTSPEKIHDAASQFEGLLIGQILKAAHDGESEGWLGTEEDQTADSTMQMGDEYLGRALAQRGGFGLAQMVTAGLERQGGSEVNNSSPGNLPATLESGHTQSTRN